MNELQVRLSADTQKFEAGIQRAQTALAKLPNASNQATAALGNLSRVAQDAPYGFIGIANNINPLLESFQRLKATTGTTGGALKALGSQLMGPAGLGLAVGVASSLLVTFGDRLFGSSKKMQEADDSAKRLSDSVKNIFQGAGKEAAEVNTLIAVLNNETETRQRKLAAIQELQRIQPDVFNNLKLEGDAVVGLDKAYQNYIANLKTTIAVKIKQAQLEQLLTQQLKLQGITQTENEKRLLQGVQKFNQLRMQGAQNDPSQAGQFVRDFIGKKEARDRELNQLQADIDKTISNIGELSKGVELDVKVAKKDSENFLTYQKSVISAGEKLADEMRKAGRLNAPQFFDFDGIQENYQKALQLFKDSRIEIGNVFRDPIRVRIEPVFAIQKRQQEVKNVLLGGNIKTFQEQVDEAIRNANAKLVSPNATVINTPVFDAMKKRMTELAATAEFVGNRIADVFTSAFDAIANGQNPIRAIGEAIKGLVIQLVQAAIRAAILSVIISAIAPGSSAAQGGFGGIFSRLLGFGGMRAGGGPVNAGTGYLVGERGPELFVPSTSGRIVPNHQTGSILGSAGQMFNVMVTGRISGRDLVLVQAREGAYQNRNA